MPVTGSSLEWTEPLYVGLIILFWINQKVTESQAHCGSGRPWPTTKCCAKWRRYICFCKTDYIKKIIRCLWFTKPAKLCFGIIIFYCFFKLLHIFVLYDYHLYSIWWFCDKTYLNSLLNISISQISAFEEKKNILYKSLNVIPKYTYFEIYVERIRVMCMKEKNN